MFYCSIIPIYFRDDTLSFKFSEIDKYQVAIEDSIHSCVNDCTECVILDYSSCNNYFEQDITIDRDLIYRLMQVIKKKSLDSIIQLSKADTVNTLLEKLQNTDSTVYIQVNLPNYLLWAHETINNLEIEVDTRNKTNNLKIIKIPYENGYLLIPDQNSIRLSFLLRYRIIHLVNS